MKAAFLAFAVSQLKPLIVEAIIFLGPLTRRELSKILTNLDAKITAPEGTIIDQAEDAILQIARDAIGDTEWVDQNAEAIASQITSVFDVTKLFGGV
jgi:hypothetical protein